MPQFDPTYFASQIFWLVAFFTLLYLFIVRFALPRMTDVLDSRQRRIESDLERARQLSGEAEQVRSAYEQALGSARKDARDLLSQNAQKIAKEAQARNEAFAKDIARRTKEAEARIAAARAEAMTQIEAVAVEAAASAVAKLGGTADRQDIDAAVKAARDA